MEEVSYEIAINVKAPGGWLSFGFFHVGSDKEHATATFESLYGSSADQDMPLRIQLFEHVPGDSMLIAEKRCTLNQLADNTRIITRDVFKYFNLG